MPYFPYFRTFLRRFFGSAVGGKPSRREKSEVLDELATWQKHLEALRRQTSNDPIGGEWSLEGMERGLRDANQGAPLTGGQREEVRVLHAKLEASQKALDDHVAHRIAEAEAHIAFLEERVSDLDNLERLKEEMCILEDLERVNEGLRIQDECAGLVRDPDEYWSLSGMRRAMCAVRGSASLTADDAATVERLHGSMSEEPPVDHLRRVDRLEAEDSAVGGARTLADAAAPARARIRSRNDARVAQGWDQRNSGQWMTAIGIGATVAGTLCLIAAFNKQLPYGFFQVLRWVVFAVTVAAAIGSMRTERRRARALGDWVSGMVFSSIAVLFNPISPIHLTRSTWFVIDVVCGLVLLFIGPLLLMVGGRNLREAKAR